MTGDHSVRQALTSAPVAADRHEFLKISQAVGVGFVVMGAIGYVVKLSTYTNLAVRPLRIET